MSKLLAVLVLLTSTAVLAQDGPRGRAARTDQITHGTDTLDTVLYAIDASIASNTALVASTAATLAGADGLAALADRVAATETNITTITVELAAEASNIKELPAAVLVPGPSMTIDASAGTPQRISLLGPVTSVTFTGCSSSQLGHVDLILAYNGHAVAWPATGFTWVRQPGGADTYAHLLFSWTGTNVVGSTLFEGSSL